MKLAKKLCLIGRFAVGKTSLVKQFIDQQFSDKYKTTVGVSISTKEIMIDDTHLSLIIWDIAGFEQEGHYKHYLRGLHGVIWVVDGTEPESLKAMDVIFNTTPELKQVPSICFINKHDLVDDWLITDDEINKLKQTYPIVLKCSAKTGENVEVGFDSLAKLLVQ